MKGLQSAELDCSALVAVAPAGVQPTESWENVGIVQYRSSSASRWVVENYLDEHGLRPRVAGEADDALLMVEAAARGQFIAFVPRSVARDPVAAGRLRVLAVIEPPQTSVYALYQDGESAALARRAVEVLVEHIQKTG